MHKDIPVKAVSQWDTVQYCTGWYVVHMRVESVQGNNEAASKVR